MRPHNTVHAPWLQVAAQLKEAEVALKPYDQMVPDVRALAGAGVPLWIDPSKVRWTHLGLPLTLTLIPASQDLCT